MQSAEYNFAYDVNSESAPSSNSAFGGNRPENNLKNWSKISYMYIILHLMYIYNVLLMLWFIVISAMYNSIEWVIEWLLINANSVIFQLYHGENKLIFNDMMMRSTLY